MQNLPPPRTRRTHFSRRYGLAFFASFSLLAPVAIAQATTNSIADKLPLRNVLIEVRQVQQSDAQRAVAQTRGTLRMRGYQQSDTTTQQVLVLNGRSAHITVGTQTPMRVLQTVLRNGVWVAIPGTLVWDASTGFAATPRWNGGDRMELEISATQASGFARPMQQTDNVLMVPTGQWVTVAQSETESDQQDTTLGGQVQSHAQGSTAVQVRLTLP